MQGKWNGFRRFNETTFIVRENRATGEIHGDWSYMPQSYEELYIHDCFDNVKYYFRIKFLNEQYEKARINKLRSNKTSILDSDS